MAYPFQDAALLQEALTHASAKGEGAPSYERLEFFGDAVLGLVISEALFQRFPDYAEGDLTRLKSDLVSRPTLVQIGHTLGLNRYIATGKGISRKALPPSILADTVEAIIGAVYLDGGLSAARNLVLRLFGEALADAPRLADNAKSRLQEMTQRRFGQAPVYQLLGERGPEHRKTFRVACRVAGREWGRGTGRTKKEAEQMAAAAALRALESGARRP